MLEQVLLLVICCFSVPQARSQRHFVISGSGQCCVSVLSGCVDQCFDKHGRCPYEWDCSDKFHFFSLQAVCVELLPSGERAPEQLWGVPCREGHLRGTAQRR